MCASFRIAVGKCYQERRLKEALQILDLLVLQGIRRGPAKEYAFLLQSCITMKALAMGRLVHAHIIRNKIELNTFLGNTLIDMYIKCGSLPNALQALEQMQQDNAFSWTIIISTYNKQGRYKEAVKMFLQMQETGILPDKILFLAVLKACASLPSLDQGKFIHCLAINSGLELDVFVGSSLVDMYIKCGSIEDACCVFDRMPQRDMVLWNVMIAAYTQKGHGRRALDLFHQMQQEGMEPNNVTCISALKACASLKILEEGKLVHAMIVKRGYGVDINVQNTLVDMYGKCGSLQDARLIFHKICNRDVVSWNAMISAYVQHNCGEEALTLFEQMQQEGIKPSNATFVGALMACGMLGALEWGKQIHAHAIRSGFESDAFVRSTLIDMYVKCGNIEEACQVFSEIEGQDIVSLNAMMSGYIQQGCNEEALILFGQLQQRSIKPDHITFVCALKACIGLADLGRGKQIHGIIIENDLESNTFVGNTLVDMYAKCGAIDDAWQVFNKMNKRDVVSWNVMIMGYAQQGHAEKALALFEQMQSECIKPDCVTFVGAIQACASLVVLERGKQIHALISKSGFELNDSMGNALVDMYVKCGCLENARKLFDILVERDVFSWSALIAGYAQQGRNEEALKLFKEMQWEGVRPNNVTFLAVLKACANLGSLEIGKKIHALVIEYGFECDLFVGNSLVDMYAKCRSMEDALRVFDGLRIRNVVSWTALISGYAQQGQCEDALLLFCKMQEEGIEPNIVTYMSVLYVCASLGAIQWGKKMHAQLIKSELECDEFLGNSLLDMYTKCGSIENALLMFDRMQEKGTVSCTIVTWNVMIAAYAQQGRGEEAFELLEQMQCDGVKPNEVTFVSVLSACSHAGLIDKGCYYFKLMSLIYGIVPTTEHYVCMIDLFGRAGHLEEAKELIDNMCSKPDSLIWISFLSACRNHGNPDLARYAFEQILQLEPDSDGAHVLLSNAYAAVGMWDEVLNIRNKIKNSLEERLHMLEIPSTLPVVGSLCTE